MINAYQRCFTIRINRCNLPLDKKLNLYHLDFKWKYSTKTSFSEDVRGLAKQGSVNWGIKKEQQNRNIQEAPIGYKNVRM